MDPERIHEQMVGVGAFLGRYSAMRRLTSWFFEYQNPILEQTVAGVRFANPVGLAAGFDKNARLIGILPSVGFGFEEVGSVTALPCEGNPKPRLWRLPDSHGLVVNYGLMNDGAEVVASRLRSDLLRRTTYDVRRTSPQFFPTGISIAKTNCSACADDDAGIADYVSSMKTFAEIGDYHTINISCPNAFGGQPFQRPDALDRLLSALDAVPSSRPRFLKLSADTELSEIDRLLEIARRHRIAGFIVSNLTKKYDAAGVKDEMEKRGIKTGGVSGKPVEKFSNELISELYKKGRSQFVIIGCGGVFNAEDAYAKIKAGASLVQLITGMIYEGPQLIGQINRGLVDLLKRDGYRNISEAVGKGCRVVGDETSCVG